MMFKNFGGLASFIHFILDIDGEIASILHKQLMNLGLNLGNEMNTLMTFINFVLSQILTYSIFTFSMQTCGLKTI